MEPKTPGRPGIDQQTYINQIQVWLKDFRLDEITATMLQKAVGGQYRKAATILEEFKAGYETKELSDLPEPPEQLTNALHAAGLDIWRILWEAKTKEVSAIQAEFDERKGKLELLAEERLECIDGLETEMEQLRQQVIQMRSQAEADRRQLSETREHLATETTRREALEDKLKDKEQQLAESKLATDHANEKLVTVQRQHEDTIATMKQLGDEVLANLKQEHAAQLKDLTKQHAAKVEELQSKIEQLTADHKQISKELTEQQARADKAESQVKDAALKLVDVNELRSQESKKADKQIADLQKRLDAGTEKLTATTAELAAANQRAEDATDQLAKAEERAEEVLSRFLDTAGTWQEKLAAATKDEELDQITIFDKDDKEDKK
ncbi:TPA: hypothetical protein ACGVAU_004435 [Vibrio vulnificus]